MYVSKQMKQNGSAIIFVVFAIILLLTTGVGLLSIGLKARTYSIRVSSDIAARCAADAGLTMAVYAMNEQLDNKLLDDDNLPEATKVALENFNGSYSYTVKKDNSNYVVTSIGYSGQNQRTVTCTLRLQGPFEAAIFTEGDLSLKNSAKVDWYNYDDGDEKMKVCTGSTKSGAVDLKNSATIEGDVYVGVNGNPDTVIDLKNSAKITGITASITEKKELSPVIVPNWLQELPYKSAVKSQELSVSAVESQELSSKGASKSKKLPSESVVEGNTTISASGKYNSIDLGNSEKMTIKGDVTLYVVGNVTLGNFAEIEIENDSSLILYVGGDFEGKNSSSLNNKTEIPAKLKIYGLDNCKKMDFKNSSELYASIYAPNADITFDNSADMYGAVVCKSLEQKNSSGFYYDASLRNVSENDELVRFVRKRWSEE